MDSLGTKMSNFDTIQPKPIFRCEYCDHTWYRQYDYKNHLKTKKHEQKRKNIEEKRKKSEEKRKVVQVPSENTAPQTTKNIETKFCCDYCQFVTTVKKEANQHRTSKQHVINENKEEDFIEISRRYVCVKCEKTYDKYKSCWEHSKRCQGRKETPENIVLQVAEIPPSTQLVISEETIKKDIMVTMVDKMMDNNKQMMEQVVNMVKTILQETKSQPALTQNNNYANNSSNNSNNNSNNNNSKHYTINMFLNEKCKDAVNITDWAQQLQVDYDHLYYTGENGFQKGLTHLLVDNLKLCDVYNRPIHFTDVKRDSMYIRDADEWTKHENNEKLVEVLEISARQACVRLVEWMKEHENRPEYQNLDSELGQQYLSLMMNVIRPEVDRLKAYPKVMKELAKTAQLRKEDQV
jgi:hypothetical protein